MCAERTHAVFALSQRSSETTNTVSDGLSFNKPPQQSDKATTHRHTRIGSTASKIIIRSGVDTTTLRRQILNDIASGMTLRADMIKQLEIHLAIPAQTNKEQRLQLQRVVEYEKSKH